ncbi:conserved Plasmodium protein, unknown function [Plasmodium vinckei]|uniref:Uncharacterized protein n=1 Tax=Plasmodium vinckei TaxID=5860 RepID=A0A6V7T6U9_PLAVN|nr:conserved Plasmodium protein, unknown function [Plasmodium vinckei]
MLEIEWAAKLLTQLLVHEKCMKEKYAAELFKRFGDINQIIHYMNDHLDPLGFIVNNELINGEEYLILNCEKHKIPEYQWNDTELELNLKEEHLFNSKLKKNEISLYYLIIDYIVNNNENLKINDTEMSYESLCLQLNIRNANTQKSIMDRLIVNDWLKNENGYLSLGTRFFTDLIKYFPLNKLEKCSLCNKAIIVENIQCKNCMALYHAHCFNGLANKLSLCYICKSPF